MTILRHLSIVSNNLLHWYCTRDFTHIGYEQYGLSYLDLWTLPALPSHHTPLLDKNQSPPTGKTDRFEYKQKPCST